MGRDAGFVPDLEQWDPWRPDQVAAALEPLSVTWAIAGGWAIDLYLPDREPVQLAQAGKQSGRAWPIADAPPDLHQTWGRDRSGRWRLDVIREGWDAGDWVFRRDPRIRRPLATAIERSPAGIPYLAPEIVLLYKAKAPREKDEADLALTLPLLAPERIRWLRQALRVAHPEHAWTPRLDSG